MIDPLLLGLLKSPDDGSSLKISGDSLVSEKGGRFVVVDGIPILLPNKPDTMESIVHSRNGKQIFQTDPYVVDSLGLTGEEKSRLRKAIAEATEEGLDPVASFMVGATCGNAYQNLRGKVQSYPIPFFPLKNGNQRILLDIGCNWGRWLVSSAREGFLPVGIDPQIGALLAAKRIAKKMGIKAHFICGDGRYLPIKDNSVDVVFSYSVIQHLSYQDAEHVSLGIAKVLKPSGFCYIQMPTKIGLKGLLHRAKKKFQEAKDFDVRYWTLNQLRKNFGDHIGKTRFETDCFFGIGLQYSDIGMVKTIYKPFFFTSEMLRKISRVLPPVTYLADSVYVKSEKRANR